MSWNEPGNDNKDKTPWGKKEDSPPDLDEALRKLSNKLRKALGGGRSGGSFSGGNKNDNPLTVLLPFAFGVVFLLWALSGIFIVGPAEESVILRFGKYVETVGPGPHWIPRFIDTRITRDVSRLDEFTYSAQMLTKDENIVSVSVAIQYRLGNLQDYLFNVSDPIESLRQATASALRQVVGHTTLDQIITAGRETWGGKVEDLLKELLNDYKVGIHISSVSPQPARAPEKVQDAFDDAIKAQEDEKRYKEKAYAYAARVVPIAEGRAKRILEEAQAYSREVTLAAVGNVAEFLALLPEYKLAPAILGKRMYLETLSKIFGRTSKLLVQGDSGKMIYLPIEKMMAASDKSASAKDESQISLEESAAEEPTPTILSKRNYTRGNRESYQRRRVY